MVFTKALILLFDKSVGSKDNSGRTPLHVACCKSPDLAFRHLTKNPASYSIQDNDGRRSLHYACAGTDMELIKLLLRLEDINCRDGSVLGC
jgi:ankyrin repeat protein